MKNLVTQYCLIFVFAEPISVYFYPQKRTVDVGAFASFNCSVEGYPIDRVRWYKDALPLDKDKRVTVYENGTMVVAGMRRDDKGMYQCVASNAWGTQEATMQLSLGGKLLVKRVIHSDVAIY